MRRSLISSCLAIALGAHAVAAAPPTATDPAFALQGYWEAPFDWLTTGTHVNLLPGTGTHTQVLFWYDGTTARVWRWNPGDDLHAGSDILNRPCPSTDIHCTGLSLLASGQLLVSGGNDLGPNGLEHLNRWDPAALNWINTPTTIREPRWYPSQTTLPDGRILVTSGITHRHFVAFGGTDDASPRDDVAVAGLRGVADDQWIPSIPTGPGPAPREGHTAVYDRSLSGSFPGTSFPYRQRVMIFGGADAAGNALGDVWALSRSALAEWSWSAIDPEADPVHQRPQPRRDHVAVFDAVDSSLVIAGGRDVAGNGLADVWRLYLHRGAQGRWSRLSPAGGDSTLARWLSAVAFDPAQRRLYVVGGRHAGGLAADVWRLTLDGAPAWTRLVPSGTPPSPREGAAAVFDVPGNRLVVFGGRGATQLESDARAMTVGGAPAWSSIVAAADPVAGRPSGRWRAAHAFDAEQRRIVLFGGDSTFAAGSGAVGELWHLDLKGVGTWKRHQSSGPDGPRAGAAAIYDPRFVNSVVPEVLDPVTLASTPMPGATRWQNIYPAMFVLPSGRLIDAAPAFQTLLLDMSTGTWITPSWSISGSLTFTAAMYAPGRIMACGGSGSAGTSAARWIDLATSEMSAAWQPITGLVPRTTHNVVVLPHGEVYVMGGVASRNTWSSAVRRPQRWIPGSGAFGDTTELAPDPAVRDYHSSIALLPDGRLLSCGGDLRPTPLDRNKYTATIFWPPYLFDANGAPAPRPVIDEAPPLLGYAHPFIIGSPDAANVAQVVLMRPAATTHGFDQEQRRVPLAFTPIGTGMLEVTTPPGPTHAPPGWYLLFLVNGQSVPSVARWVRLDAGVSGAPEAGRPPIVAASPNPSRGAVVLSFDMAGAAAVDLSIHDPVGRRVRILAVGRRPAGRQSITWDGRDDNARPLPAGVYFARLNCPSGATTVKVVRLPN